MQGKVVLPIKGVRQKKYCCGPACIEMVLWYYGYKVSQDQIKKEARVGSQRGMFPSQVLKYLEKYGVICSKVKTMDVDKYLEKPRPLILGLENHYVLLIGHINKHLILIDPSTGRKSIVARSYLKDVKDYTKILKVQYE